MSPLPSPKYPSLRLCHWVPTNLMLSKIHFGEEIVPFFPSFWNRKFEEYLPLSARMEHRKALASGGALGTVMVSGVGLSLAVMALRRTKSWIARSFGLGQTVRPGFLCGCTMSFRTKLSLSIVVEIMVPVSQSRRDGESDFSLSRTTSPA